MDDVLIVSAWDRGAWLAQQLRKNLLKVKILDVSSLLPSISSVEREGPFGVFAPEDLSDTEKKYLYGDNYYSQSQGFCVLNSDGPIEFRGLISDFMRNTKENIQLCETVLSADDSKRAQLLHKKNSTASGLVQLARKWASSLPTIKDEQLSPLFASYLCKDTSSRFFEDIYREEQMWGIQRLNVNQLTHITAVDHYVSLQTEQEKHSARTVVWALGVLEILHIFPQLPALLPRKWQMPDWVWRRFNLSWDLNGFEDILPMSIFTVLDDQAPWYGANVMSIKRYPGSSQVDLWMLCPYNMAIGKHNLQGRDMGAGNRGGGESPQTFGKHNLQSRDMGAADSRRRQVGGDTFGKHNLQSRDNGAGNRGEGTPSGGGAAKVSPTMRGLCQQAESALKILFPGFSMTCSYPSDSEGGRCSYFVYYEKDDINKSILKAHPLMFFLNPESIGKMDAYSLCKGAMNLQKKLLKRLKGLS